MPTRVTIRSAIRYRISAHSADTRLTDTVMNDLVQEALHQVSLEHDWPWLHADPATITLAAGTSSYAVPGGYLRTTSIFDPTTGQQLQRRAIQDLDRITWQGTPALYAIEAEKIHVKPTPSGAGSLTHRYVQSETTLSADGTATLIPTQFVEGPVLYGAYLALTMVREDVRAEAALDKYKQWLKRARDNANRGKEPLRTRVRPDSQL